MSVPARTFAAVVLASAVMEGAVGPRPAFAQSADDIVGTWTLVSSIAERDGKKSEQFGPGATGMMSLDASGRFMLTIIGADLPKFASSNRATGTPEENKAVVGKSIALFGSYSVNSSDKTITLKIEACTFPNWNGTEQIRSLVTVTRDELKYMTARASGGGTATVTWRRAR